MVAIGHGFERKVNSGRSAPPQVRQARALVAQCAIQARRRRARHIKPAGSISSERMPRLLERILRFVGAAGAAVGVPPPPPPPPRPAQLGSNWSSNSNSE